MIEIRDVYKSYGAIKAVNGVSAMVENGGSLCVVGRSGCGKTTMLKMIAFISKPDKGSILIDGVEVNNSVPATHESRSKVSYSFQEPLLLPYLSALDNIVKVLSVPLKVDSRELRMRSIELLARFQLYERLHHLPSKLSVGEKKRVDLARALLKRTPIIVADEPLANLDPESQGLVLGEFMKFVKNGGSFVYSSVEPSQSKYADNVIDLGAVLESTSRT